MAIINAVSIEDYSDRIIYRYPGGRYEQAASTLFPVFSTGLKTLVNTETSRSYDVPRSGSPARFYRIDYVFNTAASFLLSDNSTNYSIAIDFLRILINSLNYDGKTAQTEFYEKKTENYLASSQLRAINIGNIQVEPKFSISDIQWTGLSGITPSAATTAFLIAIIQPVVTMFKK